MSSLDAEVVVERRLGEAELLGYLPQRGAVEALLNEQVEGHVQDALAGRARLGRLAAGLASRASGSRCGGGPGRAVLSGGGSGHVTLPVGTHYLLDGRAPGLATSVVRALDAAGVLADNIAVREPSLDDVFFSLTGGHLSPGDDEPGDGASFFACSLSWIAACVGLNSKSPESAASFGFIVLFPWPSCPTPWCPRSTCPDGCRP